MMKIRINKIILLSFLLTTSISVSANEVCRNIPSNNADYVRFIRPIGTDSNLQSLDLVRNTRAIPLSPSATHAASMQWVNTGVATALVGTNGAVMYAYGQSNATVTCAPEHICVIQLLPDERISNVSIGDSVRWLVQPTTAGNRPVVVIKPTVPGLNTNLVVTTTVGRIYYITLVSDRHDYVPLVGYYDPQALVINMQQQADATKADEQAKADARKSSVIASLGTIDPAALDFDFACKPGKGSEDEDFKPVRIFAGNGHTYLQMPVGIKDTDMPAVFNFSDQQTELMNSHQVHDYVVIDGLPKIFKLVAGTRSEICEHNSKKNSWFH
jgi:type IV secretion system protein VirB9